MRRTIQATVAILLLGVVAVADAAQPPPGSRADPQVAVAGTTLHYTGLLNRVGLERLRTVLAQHPELVELQVNSSGGEALPAIEIGTLVRARALSIRVEQRCNSACANYLFVPATRRTIAPGAMVVWHNACPQNLPADLRFSQVLQGKVENVGGMAYVDGKASTHTLSRRQAQALDRDMRRYFRQYAQRHTAFFAGLGVDSRIVCLGDYVNLPKGKGQAYTMSVEDMARFGVCGVTAEPDYLARVERALARDGKSATGGVIRLADFPQLKLRQPQPRAACAPASARAAAPPALPAGRPRR
ncbi:hypothetical protein [Agrilutibacter solisilvae]|uniref:Uncharacterized protein n=1 Tax=Agrilutibacter solisilvae TaxID=2763317 RepID=A0A974Y002_9GAMM|nr:hypothetical protein [Lysobacter solisilvae]QSX78897.1 hypothetical protein I8J32_002940 [Lysobacter solisilvae]